MKKILSLVLVACMLFSSLVLLSSCGKKISVKDIEENPIEALSEVAHNTSMFTDELGIGEIIAGSANGGSVSIVFESDTLMGDITSIGETIYMNGKDKQFVSDTLVKYAGQDLAARIFVDKSGLILNSETLLGSDKSIEINLATLAEGFTDSVLAEMMGMPAGEKENVDKALDLIKNVYEKYFTMFDDMQTKSAEMLPRLLETLEQTVSEEKITIDGKDVKCIVVSYTITNKSIEAYMDLGMEFYEDIFSEIFEGFEEIPDLDVDSLLTEMKASLEEAKAEMNDSVTIDLKLNFNIDPKSATLVSETLKGTVVEKGTGDKTDIDCALVFGDDNMTFKAYIFNGDEEVNFDATVTKTVKGDTATFNAVANYKVVEDGETDEGKLADITYTYTHKTGDFKLEGTIGPEEDDVEFALEGTMKVENDSAEFKITSVTADAVTVTFDLSVTFNKTAEIPARPADAVDIVEMTQGDWVDLLTEIQNGPLGAFLAG